MNSQPKWDIYESVVLLNGYLLACKKSEPRAYIIRRVSADLRAMAIHRGRKIDEIFRNENGISYQIGSGEATWLWNMDTGLEELRKLLVDYKIILQSTQLGIKSASFFSCMQAWKEYTRYIKSPASVITAKCPELMYSDSIIGKISFDIQKRSGEKNSKVEDDFFI